MKIRLKEKWKNSKIFSTDSERAPSKIVGYEFLWKNSTGFIELHSVKLSSTKNCNCDVKGLILKVYTQSTWFY